MKAGLLVIAATVCLLTCPASAEDVRQRVDQSCRTGMTTIKEAAFLGFPNASDAERAEAEKVYQVKEATYCGCVAQSVPVETIKPADMKYVYYMLENAAVDRDPIEQKLSLAWNGLDEGRMSLFANAFAGWTLKCPM